MCSPIRVFCDISEAIENVTYLSWPEVSGLTQKPGTTHFPGSLYAVVTRRLNHSADEARIHAVESGVVGYETADGLVMALLTACHSAIALHIENGKLRQLMREPFSVRELELEVPPDDVPIQAFRDYQSELEQRSRRNSHLRQAIVSAREPLRRLSDTLAACLKRTPTEETTTGHSTNPTAEPTTLTTGAAPAYSMNCATLA